MVSTVGRDAVLYVPAAGGEGNAERRGAQYSFLHHRERGGTQRIRKSEGFAARRRSVFNGTAAISCHRPGRRLSSVTSVFSVVNRAMSDRLLEPHELTPRSRAIGLLLLATVVLCAVVGE